MFYLYCLRFFFSRSFSGSILIINPSLATVIIKITYLKAFELFSKIQFVFRSLLSFYHEEYRR